MWRLLLLRLVAPLAVILAPAGMATAQPFMSPLADLSKAEIQSAMADVDAATSVSMPDPSGFDLTKPWPGTAQAGWTLSLDIKADVAVKGRPQDFATVTRITYRPPSTVQGVVSNASGDYVPMDGTWYPCTNLWLPGKLKVPESENLDAGCSGVLPAGCVSDMRKSLGEGFFGDWDSQFVGGHCPFTRVPDSCKDVIGTNSQGTLLLGKELGSNESLTHYRLQQWYIDDFTTHKAGDSKSFNTALGRVWIVGTTWGYSKNSAFANGSNPDVNATITCLRAKLVESSSNDLPPGDGGSGARASAAWTWTWALIAISVATLFSLGL